MNKEIKKTHVYITKEIYKKSNKLISKFWLAYSITSLAWIFLMILDFIFDKEEDALTLSDIIISNIVLLPLLLLIFYIINLIKVNLSYKKMLKKNHYLIEYNVSFLDESFTIKNERFTRIVNYSEIVKCVREYGTIYLVLNDKTVVPLIEYPSNFIELINKCPNNVRTYNNEIPNYVNENRLIKAFLIVLFILCLFTPFIICLGYVLYTLMFSPTGIDKFKTFEGSIIAIIIPILSLVYGIIFKKKGYKCTKNIVIAIINIILVLLIFIMGLLAYKSAIMFNKDYSKLIGFDIPDNSKGVYLKWNYDFSDEIVSYEAVYEDDASTKQFYENIKENSNWNQIDNIDNSNLIPNTLACKNNEECYYLIYNKTIDKYNLIPYVEGKYKIIAMMYNATTHKFKTETYYVKINN